MSAPHTKGIRTGGVTIRPAARGDGDALAELFEAMSPGRRHRRFLGPVPQVSAGWLRHLAEVDNRTHVAWLALDGQRCVGEARFVGLHGAPHTAEVAFAVADDVEGRGVARTLLGALGVVARRRGVAHLVYTVQPDNLRALALLRRFGGNHRFEDGVVSGVADVAGGPTAGVDQRAVRMLDTAARTMRVAA